MKTVIRTKIVEGSILNDKAQSLYYKLHDTIYKNCLVKNPNWNGKGIEDIDDILDFLEDENNEHISDKLHGKKNGFYIEENKKEEILHTPETTMKIEKIKEDIEWYDGVSPVSCDIVEITIITK